MNNKEVSHQYLQNSSKKQNENANLISILKQNNAKLNKYLNENDNSIPPPPSFNDENEHYTNDSQTFTHDSQSQF